MDQDSPRPPVSGPEKPRFPLDKKDRPLMLFALRIAGDFGVVIAVPVVVLALFGRWLDTQYQTGWAFTILGFLIAAAISSIGIYRKAKRYGKEYEALIKSDK